MKRLIFALMVIALLVPMVALACEKPPEPKCPEGFDTVTPAVWHDGYTTPGHWEVRDWIKTTYKKECKQVEVLTCPTIDGVTYDKSNDPHKCHRPSNNQLQDHPYHMTKSQAKAYTQNHPEWVDALVSHKEECETVVDVEGHFTDWFDYTGGMHSDWRYVKGTEVPGYWTDPVCKAKPVITNDVDCAGVMEFSDGKFVKYVHEWTEPYVLETWEKFSEPETCYKVCSAVYEVVLNGHTEYRDMMTGELCKSECRDRWVQQSFGLFALEGPNGEKATMYVYADENGKLPIGVSAQRQECVLGWVAVNTPYAGWVYKNPCTGEYKWNDQTFTPRRDVIKHGVCDRSQPCLVQ